MTEWLASEYYEQSSLQKTLAEEQLRRLTLEGSERILDVGCGDGKISAAIAARVTAGSVLGVDPSRDMITFAAEHFPPDAHANLRFDVADVRQLPYRDEFDLVISFNALHWVPEQAAALRSICAALKPHGQALLRFVPQGERKCLEDVIEETRQQPRWVEHFADFRKPYAHFTAEQYRALAEENGFRVLGIRVEDGAWDFKTREGFAAFARATFAEWLRRLPENEWETFITEVLDRYRQAVATSSGDQNTFKYYQMEVTLTPTLRQSDR